MSNYGKQQEEAQPKPTKETQSILEKEAQKGINEIFSKASKAHKPLFRAENAVKLQKIKPLRNGDQKKNKIPMGPHLGH